MINLFLTALPEQQCTALKAALPDMLYASQICPIVFTQISSYGEDSANEPVNEERLIAARLISHIIRYEYIPVGWSAIFSNALRRYADWVAYWPDAKSDEFYTIANNIDKLAE